MRVAIVWLMLFGVILPVAAHADDVFQDVQYISGRDGLDKKIKGTLTVTDKDVRFTDRESKEIFTIPLSHIKDVSNSVEQNPGSTGAKLVLGVFASKKEEFVYVNTESDETAEGLVFKTKNKMSPSVVAKIKFRMKKAGAVETEAAPGVATTSPEATGVAPAAGAPLDANPIAPTPTTASTDSLQAAPADSARDN